jgi:hypothetical protein
MQIKLLFPAVFLLFLLVATGGCGRTPPSSLPAATPSETVSPSSTPAPLPLSAWLTQLNVFFQVGDLPEDIQAGQLDNTIPDLALKLGGTPDGAASLSLKVQGGSESDYGNVMFLYYKDPGLLNKASQWLIQSEQARRQGAPQAGIGDIALLFLPEQPGRDTALLFQVCHSFVEIRLLTIADPAIILRYAGRLAERLQWLDCQENSMIPILTPPPGLQTPTATLPIPITQGYTRVQPLPDPQGATNIRAYAFTDQQHGWLALGANILTTTDDGKTWQLQTTVDSKVEQIRFESAQIGWILTDKGFLVTQDGGGSWQKSNSQPAEPHPSIPPPRSYHPTSWSRSPSVPAKHLLPEYLPPLMPGLVGLFAPAIRWIISTRLSCSKLMTGASTGSCSLTRLLMAGTEHPTCFSWTIYTAGCLSWLKAVPAFMPPPTEARPGNLLKLIQVTLEPLRMPGRSPSSRLKQALSY